MADLTIPRHVQWPFTGDNVVFTARVDEAKEVYRQKSDHWKYKDKKEFVKHCKFLETDALDDRHPLIHQIELRDSASFTIGFLCLIVLEKEQPLLSQYKFWESSSNFFLERYKWVPSMGSFGPENCLAAKGRLSRSLPPSETSSPVLRPAKRSSSPLLRQSKVARTLSTTIDQPTTVSPADDVGQARVADIEEAVAGSASSSSYQAELSRGLDIMSSAIKAMVDDGLQEVQAQQRAFEENTRSRNTNQQRQKESELLEEEKAKMRKKVTDLLDANDRYNDRMDQEVDGLKSRVSSMEASLKKLHEALDPLVALLKGRPGGDA